MKINTNLSALSVQNNLLNSTKGLNKAVERLSSGFKINHSSDNAANYSIVSSMDSKISSLEVASDNVAMANDMTSVATDNLDLVSSHLTRIRYLMEQSANGTNDEKSRNAIQSEIDSRLSEINRIVANTDFNGIQLFTTGILPSTSKIKLTDFGMNAGTIEFSTEDGNRTVNLTNEDTLFSLITKLDYAGVKSSFNENTGYFTVNVNSSDVTDNGTGFKEILGIEDTDGYDTGILEEDIEKTSVEIADLNTRLDAIGITNGNFTIVNVNGAQASDSISVTSTIQDLFDKLEIYNIQGTLDENGVISLETSTNFIKGALANQLGIKYDETYSQYKTGKEVSTTKTLTHNTSSTATADTTMAILGMEIGDSLVINGNDGTTIATITADNGILNQSIGSFLGSLVTNGYLTNAEINNGIISLSSDVNNYVTGNIAQKLGIGVNTEGSDVTTTVAKTQTSSSPITYTVTSVADGNTTFEQLGYTEVSSRTIGIYDEHGNRLGVGLLSKNTTLNAMIDIINTENPNANARISNGVISIDNGYIQTYGQYENILGFTHELYTTSATSSKTGDAGDFESTEAITYIQEPTISGTVATVGTVTIPTSIFANATSKTFAKPIDQVKSFSGATYVSNNVTYTVVGTASDLQTALSGNQNVILSNDIDLDGFDWEIISNYTKNFNGNGHTISNLNIESTKLDVGLIGKLGGGKVSNLGLVNANICYTSTNDSSSTVYIGGIVGRTSGTTSQISNCFVADSEIISQNGALQIADVGGLVGYVTTGSSCSDLNVYNSTIENHYALPSNDLGGVIGSAIGVTFNNVNAYNITFSCDSSIGDAIGGVIGRCAEGSNNSITNSNACNIVVNNHSPFVSSWRNFIGGIVGVSNTSISNSNVYLLTINNSQTGTNSCGGIAGNLGAWRNISNCKINYIDFSEHEGSSGRFIGSINVNFPVDATFLTSCTYDSNITLPANDIGLVSISSTALNSATMADLGATGTNYITIHKSATNSNITVTVGTTTSLSELYSTIKNATSNAIYANLSSGTFNVRQTTADFIVGMSQELENILHIETGQGHTWNYFIKTYTSSDSNSLYTNTECSISGSTTLSNLGINSTKTFTTNGNNVVTIGVNDSIVSKLQNAGLGVSISNGQLTVTGDSNHYLTSMDSALKSALKINVGENYTYEVTGGIIHTNTNSRQQSITNSTTLSNANSSSLTMEDLGLTSNGTISTNNYVITVNKTDMMSEVLEKLGSAGITASINDANGTLTLAGSAQDYITSASNNLKSLLGLQTGNGYTYNTNTLTTRSDSTSAVQNYINTYTVQQTATEYTKLSAFDSGVNKTAGDLVFSSETGLKTINITSTDTIKSFRNKLAQNNIVSDFTDGKLIISANNGNLSMLDYGPQTTSKIADLMELSYNTQLDNYSMSNDINALADKIHDETAQKAPIISVQVGINGSDGDVISIDTGLDMGRANFDATTQESAIEGLGKIDEIINTVAAKQVEFAAFSNRLESAAESIYTSLENLTSSRSTLRDADVAELSSVYIRQQILQQASATLLAAANQSPSIALQLI